LKSCKYACVFLIIYEKRIYSIIAAVNLKVLLKKYLKNNIQVLCQSQWHTLIRIILKEGYVDLCEAVHLRDLLKIIYGKNL